MLPCRRFADVLADACARLGADVDRYSFIEVDLHHKLLAGLPAHSLELRPAHSRRHLYVTSYTEGFSHFVTSMTAPVASGWSVRREGLSPTGKRRLVTAHAKSGHSQAKCQVRSNSEQTLTSSTREFAQKVRRPICGCVFSVSGSGHCELRHSGQATFLGPCTLIAIREWRLRRRRFCRDAMEKRT